MSPVRHPHRRSSDVEMIKGIPDPDREKSSIWLRSKINEHVADNIGICRTFVASGTRLQSVHEGNPMPVCQGDDVMVKRGERNIETSDKQGSIQSIERFFSNRASRQIDL